VQQPTTTTTATATREQQQQQHAEQHAPLHCCHHCCSVTTATRDWEQMEDWPTRYVRAASSNMTHDRTRADAVSDGDDDHDDERAMDRRLRCVLFQDRVGCVLCSNIINVWPLLYPSVGGVGGGEDDDGKLRATISSRALSFRLCGQSLLLVDSEKHRTHCTYAEMERVHLRERRFNATKMGM
jgi:hypothetical protein